MAKKTKTTSEKSLPQTVVTFLLDRSGSMNLIKAATIEGFNAYLDALKAEKGAAIDFTFLTFDTGSLDKIYVGEPIINVKPLTNDTYHPRGGTPLVDAAVKTIRATEAALKDKTKAHVKKARVVVAIQTDGEENASSEHTTEELRGLIAQKTADGWEFVFMGAGIDAYSAASQYGIAVANTVSYDAASLGATRAAFQSTGSNTARYASMKSANAGFTDAQKLQAGDALFGKPLNSGSPLVQPPVVQPGTGLVQSALVQAAMPVLGRRGKMVPDINL